MEERLSYFCDVCAFHLAVGLPVLDEPTVPSRARQHLRRSLVVEEVAELLEALEEGDLEHIAKEAADVVVVVLGTMAEYGIPFDAVWRAVHASNMAKVGPDGTVRRRADGKVLKPEGWQPPDIAAALSQHGAESRSQGSKKSAAETDTARSAAPA
jgi:predicted HAD superfamily Cof-like phosphohydrolase